MIGRKILTFLVIIVLFTVNSLAYTPLWVREFRVRSFRISRLAGGETYKRGQPDLKTLEETEKGNCVAWSNLMAKVALHNKVEFKCYIVARNVQTGKDNSNHQITVLKDDSGQVWLQSNDDVVRVKDMDGALKRLPDLVKGDDWKKGCRVLSGFVPREGDIYKKRK